MTAWFMWKCSVTALPGTYSDPDKENALLMHNEGPFCRCDQFDAFTQGPSLQCYRTPAEALISDQSISVAFHTTERDRPHYSQPLPALKLWPCNTAHSWKDVDIQ